MQTVLTELLGKYGVALTSEVRQKILGRLTTDGYDILAKEYNLSIQLEEFLKDREELQLKYFKNIQLMPG